MSAAPAADDALDLPPFAARVPMGRSAPSAAARRHLYNLLAASIKSKKAKTTASAPTAAVSVTRARSAFRSLALTMLSHSRQRSISCTLLVTLTFRLRSVLSAVLSVCCCVLNCFCVLYAAAQRQRVVSAFVCVSLAARSHSRRAESPYQTARDIKM